jgi:tRNA-splicing ligase RtcB
MLEYKGKYTTAKVMIDVIDPATVQQIYEFINHEAFTNPVAIMPDCHKGEGAVIGFTMKMTDKIIPNIVGVDINCGMLSFNVGKNLLSNMKREDIDQKIREKIPFGTNVHSKSQLDIKRTSFWRSVNYSLCDFAKEFNKTYGTQYEPQEVSPKWFRNKCNQIGMDYDRALNSLGTLGSGNHFIEIGKSQKTGDYWNTIHSGSRQFGQKVAIHWQRQAGKGPLAFLEEEDMFGYLTDMVFASSYAHKNRTIMADLVLKTLKWEMSDIVYSVHNFIDFNDLIIRKGAIRAYKGERMIIPFNMEDGLIICRGKSNPEWNYSAPHGAGRVGARKWAKENLSIDDARHRMDKKDIYCSKLPVDELKGAYKDSKIIEDALEPTAEILDRVTPVLAMKD